MALNPLILPAALRAVAEQRVVPPRGVVIFLIRHALEERVRRAIRTETALAGLIE